MAPVAPRDGESARSPSRIACVGSALATGLCAVALLAVLLDMARHAGSAVVLGFAAALAVFAGALAWGRRITPRGERALLVLYVAALTVWTLVLSSQQLSDFGVYLRCGDDFWRGATSFRDWTHRCQSLTIPGNITYWRRSLLYTLPLGLAGAGSYVAVKLFNLALHVVTVIAFLHVTKRWLTRPQRFAATVALILFPEFWFTTTLATSDNLALLLLIGWLHLMARSVEGEAGVGELLLAALLVVALDLLRDIGVICVLAMLVLALSSARSRWRLLGLAVLSLCLTTAAGRVAVHLSAAPVEDAGLLARVVANGVAVKRPGMEGYRWLQYIHPLVPQPVLGRYTAGLFAIDLQHGLMPALGNWLVKLRELFGGGGYFYFSFASIDTNPNSLRIGDGIVHHSMQWLTPFLPGISAAYACAALLGVTSLRLSGIGHAAVAFAAAFLLLVIGFGEVQPRYAVLLAPSMVIMAASMRRPGGEGLAQLAGRNAAAAAAFLAVLCGGVLGVSAVAGRYLSHVPVLTSFVQEQEATRDGHVCNAARASVETGDQTLRIGLPANGPACYSFLLSMAGSGHGLHYYVTRDPVPARWATPSTLPVAVGLTRADGMAPAGVEPMTLGKRVAATAHDAQIDFAGGAPLRLRIDAGATDAPLAVVVGYFHDDAGNPVTLAPKP